MSIHEDNSGSLVLAETLPPQFTPRRNHYSSKTIWFCEKIHKHEVKLKKIATVEKLGDTLKRAFRGLASDIFARSWWYGRYMSRLNNALRREC